MARISFKQGIIRHQTDTNDNPTFLQKVGNDVNLVVSQDLTIITFVHGTKNYLFTESVTQEAAWGPFSAGIDYWLYWDLNRVTGVRTFGHTNYEPVTAAVAPTSPVTGQMWFNSSSNLMYDYNGASWVEVIRVFACKLEGGITFTSMSIDAPLFTGTQVGLTTTSNIGSLVFDTAGKPIFNGFGKFFTTEDIFTTGVPTGASLKINNILIRAQAQQPIASYHVVEFSDYNKVIPGTPYSEAEKVYGFIEEDVVTNEVVNIITEGIIFNENWDWPATNGNINDPLYITTAGEITLDEQIPDQIAVGAIVGPQSILFSPGIYGYGTVSGSGGVTDHGILLGLNDDDHIQYHNDDRGDIRYHTKTVANTTFAPITHAHIKSDITDFIHTHSEYIDVSGDTMTGFLTLVADPTTALHAATKQYVDTIGSAGIKWIEPILTSIFKGIVNDPSGFGAPTAEYDAYVVGDTPAGDFDGFASGTLVSYNGSIWVDILPSGPIQVGDRLGVTLHPSQYPPLNVDAGVTAIIGKVISITNNTPGSVTWTEITPDETDAVFLNNPDAHHFGHSYTFSGTWGDGVYGTDHVWIEFQSGLDYIAGTNIEIAGKTINVSPQGVASELDADLWDGQQSNISTPAAGETLVYDGTTAWENGYSARIINLAGTTSITTDVTADTIILTSTANEVHDSVATNAATLKLYEASNNGTNSIEIGAPAILAADTIFTFPPTNGTVDQVLRTDGAGVTTWVDASGGNPTCLIDVDSDSFVTLGYSGTACTDSDNNFIQIQTGYNDASTSGEINIITTNSGSTYAGNVNITVGSTSFGQDSVATGNIIIGTRTTDGNITLTTGVQDFVAAGEDSGSIDIQTGKVYGSSGNSGAINISTGIANADAASTAGAINIAVGNGFGQGAGVNITGGLSSDHNGGDILLSSGSTSVASGYQGGDIVLRPGWPSNVANTTGTDGIVKIHSLSDQGSVKLQLYTQGGTSEYTTIGTPDTLAGNTTFIYPPTDGTVGQVLITDGTGVTSWDSTPYDINIQGFGALTNGDILGRYVVPRNVTLKATGHVGLAQTAPITTDATFTIYSSTGAGALTSIGTIVFAAESQIVTSANLTTDRNFVIGDVITIECTTASSIEDVTISLLGIVT